MRKKPLVYIDIDGPDGNVLFMLGKVREALRKERRINDYNELREKVLQAEAERVNGAKTLSVSEARKALEERRAYV